MAWVIIFILFSLGIVLVGSFQTIQAVCVIAGFPLIFVCALLLVSIFHAVHDGEIPIEIEKEETSHFLKKKLTPKFFLCDTVISVNFSERRNLKCQLIKKRRYYFYNINVFLHGTWNEYL